MIQSSRFKRLILLLVPISQTAIDIYLPSFPAIAQHFKTTASLVQLTLTFYLLALAVSQFLCGGLADHYGRKPIVLVGLALYFLGSISAMLAPSIQFLIAARFLQGLGSGAILIVVRALARDLFSGAQFIKMMSYFSIMWSLPQIIAPVVGGYIQKYFNWRINFLLLAIYSLPLLAVIWRYLPETLLQSRFVKRNFVITAVGNYYQMLLQKQFLITVISRSITSCFLFAFGASAPFIFQQVLEVTPAVYGKLALLMGVMFLLGATLNNRLIHYCQRDKLIRRIKWILLINCIIAFMFAFLNYLNIGVVLVPSLVIAFLIGNLFPNYSAKAMEQCNKEQGGSAGALLGTFTMLGGSIISSLMSYFPETTFMPLASVFVTLALLLVIIP